MSAEFTNNSSISEDLGMSPFEVDLGYVPRTPLDMVSEKSISLESTDDFK